MKKTKNILVLSNSVLKTFHMGEFFFSKWSETYLKAFCEVNKKQQNIHAIPIYQDNICDAAVIHVSISINTMNK